MSIDEVELHTEVDPHDRPAAGSGSDVAVVVLHVSKVFQHAAGLTVGPGDC